MADQIDPKVVVSAVVGALGGVFAWLRRRENRREALARLTAKGEHELSGIALRELLDELSDVREEWRDRVKALEAKLDKQREDLERQLKEEREAAKAREEDLRQRIDEMRDSANTYRNTISGLNERISTLQDQNSRQERRIQKLEAQIVEMGGKPRNGH